MLFLRQISVGVIYGMVYGFICFRTANRRRVLCISRKNRRGLRIYMQSFLDKNGRQGGVELLTPRRRTFLLSTEIRIFVLLKNWRLKGLLVI